MQFYFYLARILIPLMWTGAVQLPELDAGLGTIHFVLLLVRLRCRWFFRNRPSP